MTRKIIFIAGVLAVIAAICFGARAQVAVAPLNNPHIQLLGSTGVPLAGGKVYTYAAGSSTPVATYSDAAGTTLNANPVLLDSGGFATIFLKTQAYKLVAYNAAGVLQWSIDNLRSLALLGKPFESNTLANRPTTCSASIEFFVQTDSPYTLFQCNSSGTGWNAVTPSWVPASLGNQGQQLTINSAASAAIWQSKPVLDPRDYSSSSDPGVAIAAAISAAPSTGAVINAQAYQGTATVTAFNVTKPIKLQICGVSWTLSDVIGVTADFIVDGCDRNKTSITSASASAIFNPSGTAVKDFEVRGVHLIGGSSTSSVVTFPDFNSGVNDFSQGIYGFTDTIISGFGANPVNFGVSQYMTYFTYNQVTNSHGGVSNGKDSEPFIAHNQFWNQASGPALVFYGHSLCTIEDNDFELDGASSTDPDIRIYSGNSTTPANTGYCTIQKNKFGPEGESASRYKIETANPSGDTSHHLIINVRFINNQLSGVAGQKFFHLQAPMTGFLASENLFNTFGTVFDDEQAQSTAFYENMGVGNVISNNRYINFTAGNATSTLCTNGCRNFDVVDYPVGVSPAFTPIYQTPKNTETPSLSNYLEYSEDMSNAAWVKNNVSVTTGQTDPFGGVRAVLLTKGNASTSDNIAQVLQTGYGQSIVCSVWLKQGTSSLAELGVKDTTSGNVFKSLPVTLDATWRRYVINAAGLVNAHDTELVIYPDGFNQSSKTIYAFGNQCSDYNSDYQPTTGAKVSDVDNGMRLGRGTTVAGPNGGSVGIQRTSEEITLSTSGLTTDSVNNLLPANSTILGVGCRITQTIDVVTNWAIGDASTAARLCAADSTLSAGETCASTGTAWTTGIASATTGTHQTSAAKLRVTLTTGAGNPTQGKVRCTVWYQQTVPPTN